MCILNWRMFLDYVLKYLHTSPSSSEVENLFVFTSLILDKCLHSYEISSQYSFSYIPHIFYNIFLEIILTCKKAEE